MNLRQIAKEHWAEYTARDEEVLKRVYDLAVKECAEIARKYSELAAVAILKK